MTASPTTTGTTANTSVDSDPYVWPTEAQGALFVIVDAGQPTLPFDPPLAPALFAAAVLPAA